MLIGDPFLALLTQASGISMDELGCELCELQLLSAAAACYVGNREDHSPSLKILVYLDNCVLNRPFDDQKQPRIWLETLALSLILQMAEAGEIDLLKSPMHFLENDQSPFVLRRQWVEYCLHLARNEAGLDQFVKSRAEELQRGGLKPLDALHVACAETAGARHFLTCDDRLIRRYVGKMAVLNPLDFILQLS